MLQLKNAIVTTMDLRDKGLRSQLLKWPAIQALGVFKIIGYVREYVKKYLNMFQIIITGLYHRCKQCYIKLSLSAKFFCLASSSPNVILLQIKIDKE